MNERVFVGMRSSFYILLVRYSRDPKPKFCLLLMIYRTNLAPPYFLRKIREMVLQREETDKYQRDLDFWLKKSPKTKHPQLNAEGALQVFI